jgi:hypothetical protein
MRETDRLREGVLRRDWRNSPRLEGFYTSLTSQSLTNNPSMTASSLTNIPALAVGAEEGRTEKRTINKDRQHKYIMMYVCTHICMIVYVCVLLAIIHAFL